MDNELFLQITDTSLKIGLGALIAAGPAGFGFAKAMGFLAVVLASVNIFGGFIVAHRMLQMFKKKTR